ncbi:MAG: M20/M25/M40 family metallo-hydrolase [Anaerolineae bacterium]|nr:M20/M25/M40 family metallo-hydrolase [Anaerolineae bacterium]
MRELVAKLDQMLDWSILPTITQYTIDQSTTLQQIPAPTFQEKARANYVIDLYRQFDLRDLHIDSVYNAYGRLPGKNSDHPALMVSAHTDTVFPADADLTQRREANLIYGPGLGDNCFGLGGMLGLLAFVCGQNIVPDRDIWFVATSREEGLGDLGGIKAAYETLKSRIHSVVNLEGLAFGHIYHAGIAVRRLHITTAGAGGHSWLHYGRQSAIHGIIQLGSRILALDPPQAPRTTYNIGMLEGGQGINVIATSAGMWLDMRSESPQALAQLEQQVRGHVADLTSEDLSFQVEVVGDRPAGSIPAEHPLVQAGLAALAQLGVQGILETGSTDANVPLADGCPAVTIGITRGGNAHRLDEYVELGPVTDGVRQLILLALAGAGSEKL